MMRRALTEYVDAPSGKGPHAEEWKDKPHRLVYDLANIAEQLATALVDVLDGNQQPHDIHANTGLPEQRCRAIYLLYCELTTGRLPRPTLEAQAYNYDKGFGISAL